MDNTNLVNANLEFEGERFNSFDGTSNHAGPIPGKMVPQFHPNANLHYNVNQIISPAQRSEIKTSGIMAFHCIGDTGNDDHRNHNGKPYDRQDVADLMVAQCPTESSGSSTPCFCYHVGDVIYPGSDEALYEKEFYEPYSAYPNAIVAIPGNHDSYGPGGLATYAQNFMQPVLNFEDGIRPAMNLPGFHWVMDTPVATIIGLAAVANNISTQQQQWFNNEMKNADDSKALIVAVHYPPYCFDGSDNRAIRSIIENAIVLSKRTPDLVLSGHSHNFQHIEVPKNSNRPSYNLIVNGAGGVSVGGVKPWKSGNHTILKAHNDTEFGALKVIVDSKKKKITCEYYIVFHESDNRPPKSKLFYSFDIDYAQN